jgi:hypothetical protein
LFLGTEMEKEKRSIGAWPQAMSLECAAQYTCTSVSTLRDWVSDGLLRPLRLPGTCLRDRGGRVITRPRAHTLNKIIVLKSDVDALLEKARGAE